MLHQRDRERVGDVGAILLAAAKPELENARKHPAALLTDGDRSVEVVGGNLRTDLAQQPFRVAVLRLKKDHRSMTTARPTIEMSKSSHISQPPCCMRPKNPENTPLRPSQISVAARRPRPVRATHWPPPSKVL